MKQIPFYFYVGPKEIEKTVKKQYEGTTIRHVEDLLKWIKMSHQTITNGSLITTFIINEQAELVISDRHSEHIRCAGGRAVLSAGEITFCFDEREPFVSEITNQSTGYCPRITSWKAAEIALNKIGIEHPNYWTTAFEFRYCEHCQTKNLVKESVYECAVCEADLDLVWNIFKMK